MLETTRVMDLAIDEKNVAQYGKQVGLQRANDAPIDKRVFRWVDQFQLHAAFTAQHVNVETFKTRQQLFAVVCQTAGVQNGKRTVTKQLIQVAAGRAFKHIDFQLRQHVH